MELSLQNSGLTQTEILTRINSLKLRHEVLKQDIIDHVTIIEEKEKELELVEKEYVDLISKIV